MEENVQKLTAHDFLLFNAGDPNAFDKITRALYKTVFHFSRRLLNDKDDAEDITQETFVKLWHLRAQFNTYLNIKAFVFVTARNACYNFLRNKGRANKELLKVADAIEVAVDEDFEERERKVFLAKAQARTLEVLNEVMAELPADKREVIQLFYFQGLSKVDIAHRCGITPTAAAARIKRAVVLLRIKLNQRDILLVFMVVVNFLKKLFN